MRVAQPSQKALGCVLGAPSQPDALPPAAQLARELRRTNRRPRPWMLPTPALKPPRPPLLRSLPRAGKVSEMLGQSCSTSTRAPRRAAPPHPAPRRSRTCRPTRPTPTTARHWKARRAPQARRPQAEGHSTCSCTVRGPTRSRAFASGRRDQSAFACARVPSATCVSI